MVLLPCERCMSWSKGRSSELAEFTRTATAAWDSGLAAESYCICVRI